MSEPILGRAYPALLEPGLRVVVDGLQAIVLDARGDRLRLWPISGSFVRAAAAERARIDYADPHTRDRVCRTLEARQIMGPRDLPEDLRAVADLIWGEGVTRG